METNRKRIIVSGCNLTERQLFKKSAYSPNNLATNVSFCFVFFVICTAGILRAQVTSTRQPVIYKLSNGKFISKQFADSLWTNHIAFPVKKKKPRGIEITYLTTWDSRQNVKHFDDSLKSWVGQPMRSFLATTLRGDSVSSTEYRKGVVILNFWFAGCKPCVQELPDLNRLVKTYGKRGVRFIAFTFDDVATTRSFIQKHKFNYRILCDEGLYTGKMNIAVYPTHIVVKDGIILRAMDGAHPDIFDQLSVQTEQALKSE